MNFSAGTWHVLRQNWQVWIMRWVAPSPGHLHIWTGCQRNYCLHWLLWRGGPEWTKKGWGGSLSLQGGWSKINARNARNESHFHILRHALVMWSLQPVLLPVGIVLLLSLGLLAIKGCFLCSEKCILIPFMYRRYPGKFAKNSKGSFESKHKLQSFDCIIWGELSATWWEVARILQRAFNPVCWAYQQEAHCHLSGERSISEVSRHFTEYQM